MRAMASQITGVSIVYLTVCSGADQRKHQSSASLAFVRGIHRWLVKFPHKEPITRKQFSFDDVTMVRIRLQMRAEFKRHNCSMLWHQIRLVNVKGRAQTLTHNSITNVNYRMEMKSEIRKRLFGIFTVRRKWLHKHALFCQCKVSQCWMQWILLLELCKRLNIVRKKILRISCPLWNLIASPLQYGR